MRMITDLAEIQNRVLGRVKFVVERVGKRIEITNNDSGSTGVFSLVPEAYSALVNHEI